MTILFSTLTFARTGTGPRTGALFAALLLALWAGGGHHSCAAASPDAPAAASAGDYSAMECLHKASLILGKPTDMLRLLTSKNVRQNGDTSISDFAATAEEQGIHASSYADLSIAQLRHATFPAVLHVRGSRYSAQPDHFIICMSIQNDEARIFNPPAMEKSVPLECLATRWKGEAVLFSADGTKLDLSVWRYEAYLPTAVLVAVALAGIGALRLLRRFSRKSKVQPLQARLPKFIMQSASLVLAAIAVAYGSRLALGQGWVVQAAIPATPEGPDPMDFLLKIDAAGAVAERVAEIDLKEALSLQASGALFVDARDTGEFSAAHITGAISCPASDSGHIRLNMAGIPKNRKIVAYCIDANCGKGHYVAATLMQQGYTQVVLYRDGWVKWTGPKDPH